MMKHLIRLVCCLGILLIGTQARAQGPIIIPGIDTSRIRSCSSTSDYFRSLQVPSPGTGATAALVPPATFPKGAIDTCGKVIVYYEDLAVYGSTGVARGFAASGGLGLTRRNTMCAVLTYFQTVIDFSKIPSGQYLRYHIDTSYAGGRVPPDYTTQSTPGRAAPFNDTLRHPGRFSVNGFVYDFLTSGIDPNINDYHANMVINFDSLAGNEFMLNKPAGYQKAVNFNSSLSDPASCELDLYSWLLHFITHTAGFYGLQSSDVRHTFWRSSSRYYTNLDSGMYLGPDPRTVADPFGTLYGIMDPAIPGTIGATCWVNNKHAPDNAPMNWLDHTHFDQYNYLNGWRLATGDYESQNVMGYFIFFGEKSRTYSKQDLHTLQDVIKLPLAPSFITSHDTVLNNRKPWSTRMASYSYSTIFANKSFAEAVPTDYTLVNNIGASVTITIAGDTTIKDPDGDNITIIPESIFNIRGCGNGGNNHNQLTLSPDHKTFTYTPRHNFYGRAQFGFNLTDGKERGGFVIYTIEVLKGNNVSLPADSNYILNGNFEEGSETKITDTAQNVNNSIFTLYQYFDGRITKGMHYSDAHPYDCYTTDRWGTAIRNSSTECNSNNKKFGYAFGSFPFKGARGFVSVVDPIPVDSFPEANKGVGNRYQPVGAGGILFNLADSLRKCHRYILELDIRHTYPISDPAIGYAYPAVENISLGFTQHHFINDAGSLFYGHMLQQLAPATIPSLTDTKWQHISIPFTYCSDTPANLLHLNSTSAYYNPQRMATLFMDNVVLKEQPLDKSLAAKDSLVGTCSKRLYAAIPNFGCPRITYTWRTLSGTLVDTGSSILVAPLDTTDYVVTAYDGCQTAKDTIRVNACPCGPGAFFGTGGYTRLTGTVSTLGSGNYYIDGNITISGSPTWTGAKVLIAAGASITVGSSALLTIDSSHLFTCPTAKELWKGISLTTTGRISVQRNSLVEDALTAISCSSPSRPGSGYIMDIQNSTFNRNMTGIAIDNYTDATATQYPFRFRGNIFTCRNLGKDTTNYPLRWPLTKVLRGRYKSPYTGLPLPGIVLDTAYVYTALKSGGIPYAGIRLNNVGYTNTASMTYYGMVIGDRTDSVYRNIFDYMPDGIYAKNVNLTLYNNMFIQAHKQPLAITMLGALPAPLGGGLSAQITDGKKYRLWMDGQRRTGGNDDHDIRNMFYDCDKGVYAVAYWDTRIYNSQLQSSNAYPAQNKASSGINVRIGSYGNCYIDTNYIANIPLGIGLFLTSSVAGGSYGPATINKNDLRRNDWLAANQYTDAYIKQGISVTAPVMGDPSAVSGNSIKVDGNYMLDVYNGINVSYCQTQRVLTTGNIITLKNEPPVPAQYAVSYTSVNNGLIQGNTLVGNGPLMGSDKAKGVYATYNTGLLVCSNTINQLGNAFEFSQLTPQPGTRWLGNSMGNYLSGFVLGSPIGDQSSKTWYRWPGTAFGIFSEPGGNIWGSTSVPLARHTLTSIPSSTSKLYVRTNPGENPTLNTGSALLRYSFGSTIITSTGAPSVCSQTFDPVTTTTGSLTSISISGTLGVGAGSPLGPIHLFTGGLGLLKTALAVPGSSDSSIQYQEFVAATGATRLGWLTQIEGALSLSDNATASSLLASPVPAAPSPIVVDTDVVVYDISDADNIVGNYTSFYALYNRYLNGSFDSTNDTQLQGLTLLCPSENGTAVYQARNLYAILHDSVIVYDDAPCMPGTDGDPYARHSLSTDAGQQQYSLYPNPNNGTLTLQQSVMDKEPVKVSIYDLSGKMVFRQQISFVVGRAVIQLHNSPPGIYLLQLSDTKGHNFTMKFTIK